MDTRETPATKATNAAAPQRVPRVLCALVVFTTFLTQDEILGHTGMCCLLLPINRVAKELNIVMVDPSTFSHHLLCKEIL